MLITPRKKCLNMIKFVYKVVDEVTAEAKAMVQHILCEDTLCSVTEAEEICLAETTWMVQRTMCKDKVCVVTETEGDCLEYATVAKCDCLEDNKNNQFQAWG